MNFYKMKSFIENIRSAALESLHKLYGEDFQDADFQINETKPEFSGDYTLVLFALVKKLKKNPAILGKELGEELLASNPEFFTSYQVIKGFLNLTVANTQLVSLLKDNYQNDFFGKKTANGQKVMIEYASPNTNKPLHLGHLRNIFLGWSMSEILKTNGFEVIKSSIINDRGIHICKSMIAWQKLGDGATPDSTGSKGDHLVGDYYVKFNDIYQEQIGELMMVGMSKEEAERNAPVMQDAREMLLRWESGDPEVRSLWAKMNGWVYKGFEETFKRIGCDFDKTYYESETYLLGKEFVEKGLEDGVLFKKEDGSVWVDLSEQDLGEKLVLRGDGTSVYITQDIGLAIQKFEEYKLDRSIYVIGDEQIHHMKVLKEICRKLGMPIADLIFHLSYGMVELTTGKMKSREGTVVDADDLVDEMVATAAGLTEELGKVNDFSKDELQALYEMLGLGAMKFYLLRVDPKKRMVFDPQESIDFHGFTGPFVQYTYARIQSILRKVNFKESKIDEHTDLLPLERQLILLIERFGNVLSESAEEMNPSVIANYVFSLAKLFNSFYAEHSVAHAETEEKQNLRLYLSIITATVIRNSMQLLGIRVPDRM